MKTRNEKNHFNNERCPKCKRMCRGSAKGWHCEVCDLQFNLMEANTEYNLVRPGSC